MLIDTHSHLNFSAYKNDLDEVIKRSLAENVWMINAGTKYETSKRAVEIAEKYSEGVYAAIGLHPIHIATDLMKIKTDPEEGEFLVKGEDFDKEKYKKLAPSKVEGSGVEGSGVEGSNSRKVVAIGEIGLDYYYRPKTKTKQEVFKEKQKTVLCKQLELAQELNLPVIFHCRMAHNDLIEILDSKFPEGKPSASYGAGMIHDSKLKGVIHCFTGTWEEAKKYLDMGFYLGINGIMYKFDLSEVIKKAPLDKILIETDCPYLIPPSARRSPQGEGGRNEPIFVKYIAEDIAKIKNISFEEICEATFQNAKILFKI